MNSTTILFIRLVLYLILSKLFTIQKSYIKYLENINDELLEYNTKLIKENQNNVFKSS